MIDCKVTCESEVIYRTSVCYYSSCKIFVERPDFAEDGRILSETPSFAAIFPFSPMPLRNGLKDTLDARGTTIGSVSFVSGVAARDGTETYDLSRVGAEYEYDENGLHIQLTIELGQAQDASFSHEPPDLSGRRYLVDANVPYSNYLAFWKIEKPLVREHYRGVVGKFFGERAAEAMIVDG